MPENDCPELTEKTAEAIDNASLRELFVSTQMNNLDLCGKAGIKWVSYRLECQCSGVDNLNHQDMFCIYNIPLWVKHLW